MTDPYATVVVPIANRDDARRTGDAVAAEFEKATVVAVYVVKKAGGAPDAAGVEQRKTHARRLFDAFESRVAGSVGTVETCLSYGTDVADAILETGADVEAEAVVFVPRRGTRWRQILSGDVARKLINRTRLPVLVLPGDVE